MERRTLRYKKIKKDKGEKKKSKERKVKTENDKEGKVRI